MAWLFRTAVMFSVVAFTACQTAEKKSLSEELPPGYRGTAIEVSAAEGEMVHVRDRIDILVTRPLNKAEPGGARTSETILQNVLVFRVSSLANGRTALYVALNPNEAQVAVLEDISDHFHVAVRPRGDTGTRPMEIIGFRKLWK